MIHLHLDAEDADRALLRIAMMLLQHKLGAEPDTLLAVLEAHKVKSGSLSVEACGDGEPIH